MPFCNRCARFDKISNQLVSPPVIWKCLLNRERKKSRQSFFTEDAKKIPLECCFPANFRHAIKYDNSCLYLSQISGKDSVIYKCYEKCRTLSLLLLCSHRSNWVQIKGAGGLSAKKQRAKTHKVLKIAQNECFSQFLGAKHFGALEPNKLSKYTF
jgi:hypothetical protein